MPRPGPRLAPVTTMLRMSLLWLSGSSMVAHHLSGCGDVERRDNADCGRHLVLGEAVAAGLEDLALWLGGAGGAPRPLRPQHPLRGPRQPRGSSLSPTG